MLRRRITRLNGTLAGTLRVTLSVTLRPRGRVCWTPPLCGWAKEGAMMVS